MTRCTQKDSIWLQHAGGAGCIFEHNPKIGDNPSLVYSWMINLSLIHKIRLMIHLSSPTTKNLCHILETTEPHVHCDLFRKQKAKRL